MNKFIHPKITVTMPAYNASKFIKEAIESVLAQDHDSFELVILDDGSTDNTWEIIRRYKKDPRVRAFRNRKNHGVGSARNKLVRSAKGRYISLCDADDLMLPDNLKALSRFLDTHPRTGVVYGNLLVLNLDKKSAFIRRPYVMEAKCTLKWDLLEKYSTVPHPGSMIRKGLILKAGGYDETLYCREDAALWSQLFDITEFAHLKDGIYYLWRRHPLSKTRTAALEKFFAESNKIKAEAIRRRYGFDFKFD